MSRVTKEKIAELIIDYANKLDDAPYESLTADSKYYRVFCTIVDQCMVETKIKTLYPEFTGFSFMETLTSNTSISEASEVIADKINNAKIPNYGKELLVKQVTIGLTIKDLSRLLNIKASRIKNIQKNKCQPTNTEKVLINVFLFDPELLYCLKEYKLSIDKFV